MSKRRGPGRTPKTRTDVEPVVPIWRTILARSRQYPLSSAAVLITVILFGSIFIVGLVAPGPNRTHDTGNAIMAASINALSAAHDVTLTATSISHVGSVTYRHSGSSWELSFYTPSLGRYQASEVAGRAYLKANAAYFKTTKNANRYSGHWYRWPTVAGATTELSGSDTMSLLGLTGTGVTKGHAQWLGGEKVIPVKYHYLTIYVPLNASAAPVKIVIDDTATNTLVSIGFSYKAVSLKAPTSSPAPAAILHYLPDTKNSGRYQSVGNIIVSIPALLSIIK